MLVIEEIAKALKTSRAEFDTMFLQAQAKDGVLSADRKNFEAVVDPSLADVDAFEAALRFAEGRGWLETLVNIIIDEGLEDGSLTRQLTEAKASQGDPALQAMTNLASGFEQPDIIYKGIGDGIRWTGKIIIDGAAKGTGILIGPNLVLTAWHVVKSLFSPNAQGVQVADPAGNTRLQVEFDDFLAIIGRALRPVTPLRVNAHQNWCVNFSACHAAELAGKLPTPLSQLGGVWDYAIIRLAKAPGLTRRWASLDLKSVVPTTNEGIILFQHPAGQPLKVDQNFIAALQPPDPSAVPKFRFLHYANAVGGSSGGPCFDKNFMLFGFHQGVWTNAPNNDRVTNRGIPAVRILEHIKQSIGELPGLDPSENPVWSLGEAKSYAPVIGTDDFQKIIWRSAVAGTPKLIVITGAKGSGKTFRVELLSAMLPDGGHLKVPLSADSVSNLSAEKLAEMICTKAGVALPVITPLSEVNSTLYVWLKDELVTKVMSALDAARDKRLVWISITNLNNFEIVNEDASQFLLLLYEQTLAVDWLRIALDGMRGDIPARLNEQKESHRVSEITRPDIETYLNRFNAELNLQIGPIAIFALTTMMFQTYQTTLDQDSARAASRLDEEVRRLANAFLTTGVPN
ncbi:MAG: trypsin-like peptidase domain-containing protein [Blastocatellia bacterium]